MGAVASADGAVALATITGTIVGVIAAGVESVTIVGAGRGGEFAGGGAEIGSLNGNGFIGLTLAGGVRSMAVIEAEAALPD